jgi:hypothetical protein
MSVQEFLKEKATNFQTFLKSKSQPEHHPKLDGYKAEDLMPLLQTQLIPIYQLGKLGEMAEGIAKEFGIEGEEEKGKILRYLTCFVEISLS